MKIELIKQDGLILVPITIKKDTLVEAKFILDTGASKTIIDCGLLYDIGFTSSDFGNKIFTSTAGGRSSAKLLTLESFSSLGIIRRNFEVLAKDLASNLFIDGLLGIDFLKNHVLNIDLKNNVLTFE